MNFINCQCKHLIFSAPEVAGQTSVEMQSRIMGSAFSFESTLDANVHWWPRESPFELQIDDQDSSKIHLKRVNGSTHGETRARDYFILFKGI